MIFTILFYLTLCNGFQLYMSKITNWGNLQFSIKENARNWFVKEP